MRALDLCAGAGGLSLGLRRAGFEVQGVEIDQDACETHRVNVGPCDHASLWDWHPGATYDLVAGGIPCQSYSFAGKHAGTADPRGQLYRPFLRIAREANTRAILIENVRGMMTSPSATHGTAFREICASIEADGFVRLTYVLLNSANYGTPQNRVRLFIVAFRRLADASKFRWPQPTHGPTGGLFALRPWETVRRALKLGDGDFHHGLVPSASWSSPQGARMLAVDAPATTVSTTSGEAFADRDYRHGLAVALAALDRPSPCVLTSEGDASISSSMRGGKKRKASDTLIAALHAARVLDRPATTVDTKNSLSAAGHRTSNKVGAVRLTLEQLAALQGFPEDFSWRGATVGSRHKQVGNAVPPQLSEAVGLAIFDALRG